MPERYDTARKMLGVVENPKLGPADEALRRAAARRGRESSFKNTPVGIYFGSPDVTVPDPYFDGAGPPRTGCTFCGGCDMSESNVEDCFGNEFPTCGGCLWSQGVVQCP
jgi:cholesterol oxidase